MKVEYTNPAGLVLFPVAQSLLSGINIRRSFILSMPMDLKTSIR